MIKTKKELKSYLEKEKIIYLRGDKKNILNSIFSNDQIIEIWKFIKLLRKAEYYKNKRKTIINKIFFFYYRRKKQIQGIKIGIEINENCFKEGLNIYHSGNIVINRNASVGSNCILHGSNCIGNKGFDSNRAPVLGDNVELGFGAQIIGDVYIADGVRIGAGAVVTKSFYEKDIIIVGNPARKLEKKEF